MHCVIVSLSLSCRPAGPEPSTLFRFATMPPSISGRCQLSAEAAVVLLSIQRRTYRPICNVEIDVDDDNKITCVRSRSLRDRPWPSPCRNHVENDEEWSRDSVALSLSELTATWRHDLDLRPFTKFKDSLTILCRVSMQLYRAPHRGICYGSVCSLSVSLSVCPPHLWSVRKRLNQSNSF